MQSSLHHVIASISLLPHSKFKVIIIVRLVVFVLLIVCQYRVDAHRHKHDGVEFPILKVLGIEPDLIEK